MYGTLSQYMRGLIEGERNVIANLSNASALLNLALEDINWVGFYIAEGDELVLGPFQGKPACIRIPKGKGVCGTAFAENCTQLVEDVHKFPGHIACDGVSNSEIVIPLHNSDGSVYGVLDIDSPSVGRFTAEDKQGLESVAEIIERSL